MATAINYYKLDFLKQQKYIFSQFWVQKSEIIITGPKTWCLEGKLWLEDQGECVPGLFSSRWLPSFLACGHIPLVSVSKSHCLFLFCVKSPSASSYKDKCGCV